MSCLDNIVTLGLCPDEAESSSGFTLLNAAGISVRSLESITNDNHPSGIDMALEVKKRSIYQVRNDFIAALQLNSIVPSVSQPIYEAALFDASTSVGSYTGYRGLQIHKNPTFKGHLRKTKIMSVMLYPATSGDTTLRIFDGLMNYTYPISLVGGSVNVFDASNLSGFPFVIPDSSRSVQVLVDQSDIEFLSSKISCMKGCNGQLPNPCAWADGYNGSNPVKNEGYGVSVTFKCECDYDQVMCDLSKSFMGELIWLKWQYNIFDEQYKSNRFDGHVLYGREEIPDILTDLENRYNTKWNALMAGLLDVLRTYRDDCLDCRNVRRVVNI